MKHPICLALGCDEGAKVCGLCRDHYGTQYARQKRGAPPIRLKGGKDASILRIGVIQQHISRGDRGRQRVEKLSKREAVEAPSPAPALPDAMPPVVIINECRYPRKLTSIGVNTEEDGSYGLTCQREIPAGMRVELRFTRRGTS